jgi:hypothetical protein
MRKMYGSVVSEWREYYEKDVCMTVWKVRGGEYYEKDTSQCSVRVVGNTMRKMYCSVVREWWGIL